MSDAESTPFFGDLGNPEWIADGIEIPLRRRDKEVAQQLSEVHKPAWVRSRVYRNSLAISAVQTYCRYLAIPTERQGCDSDNMLIRELDDVADVALRELGRVECRPVPPGATVVHLPPEVLGDRQAYVFVELGDRPAPQPSQPYAAAPIQEAPAAAIAPHPPTLARILGFLLASDPVVEHSEPIELTALQPIAELFVTLKQEQDAIAKSPKRVQLWPWLDAVVTEGWETLETLLMGDTSRMQWSFRMRVVQEQMLPPAPGSRPPSDLAPGLAQPGDPADALPSPDASPPDALPGDGLDQSYREVLDSPATSVRSPGLENTMLKRGKVIQIAGYEPALLLCVQLTRISSCEVNIQLSVETMSVMDSLPDGLCVIITDQRDRAVMQSAVGEHQAILKFEFDAILGEVFSAKLERRDQTWVEHFQV